MSTKRPAALYILAFLVFFQCASGLFGGGSLIADPSGASLQMPASEYLPGTPFSNYLMPGMILGVLLGLFPLIVLIGLWRRPLWAWAEKLNIYDNYHWAWAFSLYLGLMLIIWIDIQIAFIGGGHFLQATYGLLGVAIVIFTLLPGVMRHFRQNNGH
ncbi:MAG: hypothetical protein J5I98_20440 [Phaeodactylibacter sp.]|nr:hypothetical protein [Phaeodactylibacter sp.]